MSYSANGDTLLTKGTSPLLLEPVILNVKVPGQQNMKIEALNHDGLQTGKYVQVNNENIIFDGSTTKAIWYLIERHCRANSIWLAIGASSQIAGGICL